MESRISLNDVRGCLKYRAALARLGGMLSDAYAGDVGYRPALAKAKAISDACSIGIEMGIRSAHGQGAIGRGVAA